MAQPDKQQSVLLPDLVGNKATYTGGMNTPGAQGNQSSSVKAAQVVKVKMVSSSTIEHSPQKPQR